VIPKLLQNGKDLARSFSGQALSLAQVMEKAANSLICFTVNQVNRNNQQLQELQTHLLLKGADGTSEIGGVLDSGSSIHMTMEGKVEDGKGSLHIQDLLFSAETDIVTQVEGDYLMETTALTHKTRDGYYQTASQAPSGFKTRKGDVVVKAGRDNIFIGVRSRINGNRLKVAGRYNRALALALHRHESFREKKRTTTIDGVSYVTTDEEVTGNLVDSAPEGLIDLEAPRYRAGKKVIFDAKALQRRFVKPFLQVHTSRTKRNAVTQRQILEGSFTQQGVGGEITGGEGIDVTVDQAVLDYRSDQPEPQLRQALEGVPDVTWTLQQDQSHSWKVKGPRQLTPQFRVALSAALTLATWGQWGFLNAFASQLTTHATAQAALYGSLHAGMMGVMNQGLCNTIESGGHVGKALKQTFSSESLKGLGLTMLQGGMTQGLLQHFQIGKPVDLMGHAQKGLINQGVTMGVGLVRGDPARDLLKGFCRGMAADVIGGFGANTIAEEFYGKASDDFGRLMMHGGLGGLTGGILGGMEGVASGAMGAVLGEVCASKIAPDPSLLTPDQQHVVMLKAQLATALVALATRQDASIATHTAQNAIENNFFLTPALVMTEAVLLETMLEAYGEDIEGHKAEIFEWLEKNASLPVQRCHQIWDTLVHNPLVSTLRAPGKMVAKGLFKTGLGKGLKQKIQSLRKEGPKRYRHTPKSQQPQLTQYKDKDGITHTQIVKPGKMEVPSVADSKKVRAQTERRPGVQKASPSNQNVVKTDQESKASLAKQGRAGRQQKLKELANDPKVSSADRGWLKQDSNAIIRKKRTTLRVPPGKELAHKRGFEARKGFSYQHTNLQGKDLHKLQHKVENTLKK
jgi:hypothetical protein